MSTYEISKSSLLSLKAEILKKQEELNKAKLENKSKSQKEIKKGPLEFKNKGVENRRAKDVNSDDEDLHRKSRSALEAKSRLYEKLVKGTCDSKDTDGNEKYLVHFEKKTHQESSKEPDWIEDEDDVDKYPDSDMDDSADYRAENSDDEWVEYTDCFGRTRTCLRKDLPSMKEKDKNVCTNNHKEVRENVDIQNSDNSSDSREFTETSELLSGDMRKELQRQQWEREESELRDKKNIHYQDVLFQEARTHGVGYYAFSKDDDLREKQQEALNKIRQETKEQQRLAQEIKTNRDKQLKARVLAANNRKRARMGLPPLELEDETEEKPVENVQEQIGIELPQEDLKVEREKSAARKRHVRPWDIGKEGVKEHKEYSQEEWVDLQRKKRDDEFAPPRAYNSTITDLLPRDASKGLYFSSKKRPYQDSEEMNFTDVTKPPPHIRNPSKTFVNPYKSSDKFTPTPIEDECSEDDGEDRLMQDYKDSKSNRAGVEIAPPPTYDYYGPGASSRRRNVQPESSMEDSIMEGLKFLREKIEKKKSKR